jgi:hypothetical protein
MQDCEEGEHAVHLGLEQGVRWQQSFWTAWVTVAGSPETIAAGSHPPKVCNGLQPTGSSLVALPWKMSARLRKPRL